MMTSPAEVRATLVKAVALLGFIFIVAADVWATHHFGLGLEQLAAVGGVVALVSGVLPHFRAVLSAAEWQAEPSDEDMAGALEHAKAFAATIGIGARSGEHYRLQWRSVPRVGGDFG